MYSLHSYKLSKFSVVLLFLVTMIGCKKELYSDLSEKEANQMVAVLLKHGISAEKVKKTKGFSSVHVDNDSFADAVVIMDEYGYPNESYKDLGEIFESSGFVPTPVEEKARYMHAITQELSKSISMLDGINSARVHIVLPKSDKLGRLIQSSAASVMIVHSRDFDSETIIPKIKLVVKNSIEGIDYSNISVVLFEKKRDMQIDEDANGGKKMDIFLANEKKKKSRNSTPKSTPPGMKSQVISQQYKHDIKSPMSMSDSVAISQ